MQSTPTEEMWEKPKGTTPARIVMNTDQQRLSLNIFSAHVSCFVLNDISDNLDLTFSIDADEEKLYFMNNNEVTDYYLPSVKCILEGVQGHGFKPWKQPHAEMQVNDLRAIQNILDTVQHHRLFSDSEMSFKILARKTKLLSSIYHWTSKVSLEGPFTARNFRFPEISDPQSLCQS
ncbi:hypothetical protein K7X08_008534 [Anisodus acutangulus]|uniref:Uncharacterized protein n=1 Tax=Anisodus acutangulus TaxID=402998 RepID=A0A9Q1RQ31_9SOLA|nr:hypothetical protein K7X08_008534 [Anisodus acutangulus]